MPSRIRERCDGILGICRRTELMQQPCRSWANGGERADMIATRRADRLRSIRYHFGHRIAAAAIMTDYAARLHRTTACQ